VYRHGGWLIAAITLVLVGVVAGWGRAPAPAAEAPAAQAALAQWRAAERAPVVSPDTTAQAALERWQAQGPAALAIENVGQFDARARFVLRGVQGGQLWFADDGSVWFDTVRTTETGERQRHTARLRFGAGPRTGAGGAVEIVGEERLPTRVNYFIGDDPAQWRTEAPVYARVRVRGLLAEADLVADGRGLRWEGRDGSTELAEVGASVAGGAPLDVEGARLLTRADGTLALELAGQELPLPLQAAGTPTEGGAKALARPLLQTPLATAALAYASFLGGSGDDRGRDIAGGDGGVVYLTGRTESNDFPTLNAYDLSHNGDADVFVVQLDTTVSGAAGLLYATYLGGSDGDYGDAIARGDGGVVYLTGRTFSANFPTTNAYDQAYGGGGDAFVVQLDTTVSGPAGLSYSTYLGVNGLEAGNGIAHGGDGVVYLTGVTGGGFPTTLNAYDQTYNGGSFDAFVVKLDTGVSGAAGLQYATYLGGSSSDGGSAIARGGGGVVYLTGHTFSANFPTMLTAYDTSLNGGDAFVVKLDMGVSGANGLSYSTYLGGSGNDFGYAIAHGGEGVVYLTGETTSSNFPTTPNALSGTYGGGIADAFVARLDTAANGSAGLAYASYLGGSGEDIGYGIARGDGGVVYLTGATSSANFPTTATALDETLSGPGDAFVVRLALAPGAFGKSAPASGTTAALLTPTLSWNAASGAAEYRYCIATSPGCTPNIPVTGTSVTLTAPLSAETMYYWQVRACGDSACAAFSDADGGTYWRFRTVTQVYLPLITK